MNIFKEEFAKEKDEFSAIGFENQRKSLTRLPQTGKTTIKRDAARKALAPGKRISKTGKTYWETRRNRSDQVGKKL